jgi:hypothetical protein
MEQVLNELKVDIEQSLEKATDVDKLECVRIRYLGRKGMINKLFKEIVLMVR